MEVHVSEATKGKWLPVLVFSCFLSSVLTSHAEANWLRQSYRRVVVGADAQQADKMLASLPMIAESGADTVTITAQLRGDSWYPSKMGTIAPNLSVDDAVRQGVEQAHQLGIRVIAYLGGPLKQNALKDKKEMLCRDSSAIWSGHREELCLLSPGGDWLIKYMVELAQHAPIDGIWLDGYPQGPMHCRCSHCAEAYKRDTGAKVPMTGDPKDANLRRYVLWWHEQCEAHARRMRDAIHEVRPGCMLFANVSVGRSSESWRHSPDGLCAVLDSPSVEQFWNVDKQGDALHVQFAIHRVLSAAGGKQSEVHIPMLPHHVDTTTALPEVEARARVLTVIANGAVPQISREQGRKEMLNILMDDIRVREPWLKHTRPTRFCGIVASAVNALHYGQDKSDDLYWKAVRGWMRAMMEEHLPVELISDSQLEAGDFDRLQVLVLPSTVCLSTKAQEQIEKFVKSGGGLVATSLTSLADENGNRTKQFSMAKLLGANYRADHVYDRLPKFFRIFPEEHTLASGEWVDKALWRQWCALGHVKGTVGMPGRRVMFGAAPDREVAWKYHHNQPAVITGNVGQGRVTYMGPEVGFAYYGFGYPYLRSLMAESVRQAAAQPQRDTVTGPRLVQASYFEQNVPNKPRRRVIHLLNEVSSFGRSSLPVAVQPVRDEIIPVAGMSAVLSGPVARVHLEPGGKTLEPRKMDDGRFAVDLPPLGLHSMLVVETVD